MSAFSPLKEGEKYTNTQKDYFFVKSQSFSSLPVLVPSKSNLALRNKTLFSFILPYFVYTEVELNATVVFFCFVLVWLLVCLFVFNSSASLES